MTKNTMKTASVAGDPLLFEDWFDPIEDGLRARVRGFIETMLEEELDDVLSRPRYGRHQPNDNEEAPPVAGYRHGHRKRGLTGTFGKTEIAVPRARIICDDGKTGEWKSKSLRAYQRRTKAAEALIAGAYLAGTNTRRVRRALNSVFAGAVGKDVVSRTWRKVKGDWDAWNARSLANEPIVRLILDGTVVRVRLDKKATSISLLVALGVRSDGQKVLLAVMNMGGESEAAWRALLDDLVKRGLKTPELVIADGSPGLEKALAALWSDVPLVKTWTRFDGHCPMKSQLAIHLGGEFGERSTVVNDHDRLRRRPERPSLTTMDPLADNFRRDEWQDLTLSAGSNSDFYIPLQRCTVHKHRNLLAHAPERLHEEISNDYKDMIYAQTKQEVEAKRKLFIRKWRLKHKPVADSLEEAGDKLFTFTRFPQSQWKSIRTSNAIERLHEEFKRRIKTQTVLPSAETAAMLFWALLASGQITMRKVNGWQSLAEKPSDQLLDLAA